MGLRNSSPQTLTLPPAVPDDLNKHQPDKNETSLEIPATQPPLVARISITATDDSGKWVSNLSKQDLVVYEDGVRRPIVEVQPDYDTPVSIGVVVDTSGSMAPKLPAAKRALKHFFLSLNSRDDVFLISFSTRTRIIEDFTSPAVVTESFEMPEPDGYTALYDAVIEGLQKVQRGKWSKRALLVLTDGVDNASSHSLSHAIAAARAAGVLIYTVGIGQDNVRIRAVMASTRPRRFRGYSRDMSGMGIEEELVDASTLQQLSDETGATSFVIDPKVVDLTGLDTYFQQISMELRQQYTVRFESAGGKDPREIRVVSARDNIRARAPKWAK